MSMPEALDVEFLKWYAIASMLFGPVVIYTFSTGYAKQIQRWVVTICSIALVFTLFNYDIRLLAVLYAILVLLGDYTASQFFKDKSTKAYRLLMSLAVLPVILVSNEYAFYCAVLLRMIISGVAVLNIILSGIKGVRLSVKSPLVYLIVTHLIYYGVLYYFTTYMSGYGLKIWYISSQIIMSAFLKAFDFAIRNNSKSIDKHYGQILFASFCGLLGINLVVPDLISSVILGSSIFSLWYFSSILTD